MAPDGVDIMLDYRQMSPAQIMEAANKLIQVTIYQWGYLSTYIYIYYMCLCQQLRLWTQLKIIGIYLEDI